jgi:hypothetical protein
MSQPGVAGDSPGYEDPAISAVLIHGVDRLQKQMAEVQLPSDQEVLDALSMGSTLDYRNFNDCFRVLVAQNNVLLRNCICKRVRKQSDVYIGGVENVVASGQSSSELLSLQGSAHVSHVCSQARVAEGSSPVVVGSNRKKPRLSASVSPPRVFQCPCCGEMFNEKDFDRHVSAWKTKSEQTGPVKDNTCSGFRDADHIFLSHFTGTHMERVGHLVAEIRSMLNHGANYSIIPNGSGRHVFVARRFAVLSRKLQ